MYHRSGGLRDDMLKENLRNFSPQAGVCYVRLGHESWHAVGGIRRSDASSRQVEADLAASSIPLEETI